MHVLSFKPEYILYFYMLSCVAVLLYNVCFIFGDKLWRKRKINNSQKLESEMCNQMKEIQGGAILEKRILVRRLRRVNALLELEMAVSRLKDDVDKAPEVEHYCSALRPAFLELASIYARKSEEEQAYFSYMIAFLGIDKGQVHNDSVIDYLMDQIVKNNVYCRENALKALYSVGNPNLIYRALTKMDRNHIKHNKKLLMDGLAGFCGDKEQLAFLLWEHRDEYGNAFLLAVMQFIRLCSDKFQEPFLKIMQNEEEDKELRLEAVRYFRKFPSDQAKEILLSYVKYSDLVDWEYAAIAAQSLSSYPGRQTEFALKVGLHSQNWYVRKNCAETLVQELNLSYLQLTDVLNGNDRYARESLLSIMDRQTIENQRMELLNIDV